jgi:hypothetical protein
MPDTLKYFMWGYQPHFRISATSLAERLFGYLDPRLEPGVFLVGFIAESEQDWHDICLEPENPGISVEQLQHARASASEKVKSDPRSGLFHTMQEAQTSSDNYVLARSLSAAVKEIVADQWPTRTVYCSLPARVGKYDVLVVLHLDRDAVSSHYRLKTEQVDWDNKRVPTSLIDAAAFAFFDICRAELDRTAPGASLGSFSSGLHEGLRMAGNILSLRVARVSRHFGAVDLFDTLNGVAALFYEKEGGNGSLLLAERDHPNIVVEVALREHIRLTEHRAIRRLVEVAAAGSSILCDGEFAYGFGHVQGVYDPEREDLFEIGFSGHHKWNVRHCTDFLLRVEYGKPQPLTLGLDVSELADRLERRLDQSEVDEERLVKIVETACHLGFGTQVVISRNAEIEAERLAPQATGIEPVALDEALVRKLCSVDGAILIDPQGNCHAFGLILDGIVSSKGDRNRGSRYNSAVRYADSRDDCVILVVSDDGMIDIVPKMRRRVSRSAVEDLVCQLESLAKSGNRDEGAFNQLMSAAVRVQFYFSSDQCERVNSSHDSFVAGRVMETGRMYVQHSRVEPDSELDESYFLD